MFFVWMILEIIATVCTSAIESTARSGEKFTQEKCKKIDVLVVISALLTVLLFMIGYYRVQQHPDLFSWDEIVPKSLLSYAMMFSGIYGMITLLVNAIPYAVRKMQECKIVTKDATVSLEPVDGWKCASCGFVNEKHVGACQSCGTTKIWSEAREETVIKTPKETVIVTADEDFITCPQCGAVQKKNRTCCFECGVRFDVQQ